MSKYNYGLTPFGTSNYIYNDKEKNISDYVKYMLVRSTAMFDYHNLPKTITKSNIEMLLQCNGFCVFAEFNNELYVFNGGLGGVPNAYNEPTEINVSNPFLKFNKTLKIDVDCTLMLNDVLMMGLLPIFNRYCTLLAENDITMILATVNKRVQNLISANDDNTAESARQFLKQVFDGKLGIVSETKLFDSLKSQNVNSNSVVTMAELCEFQQYTKASLYNEIGLNANTNMKRERLITGEVDMNSENLYPLVDTMLECRRIALEKVNEMFGTEITVEFNSSWDYRLFNGEPIETAKDGAKLETLGYADGANSETIDGAIIEPTGGAELETDVAEGEEETTVINDVQDGTEDAQDTEEIEVTQDNDTEENATEDEPDGTEDTEEKEVDTETEDTEEIEKDTDETEEERGRKDEKKNG